MARFYGRNFCKNPNAHTENVSANTRLKSTFYNTTNPKKVNSGMGTSRCLDPKVWDMIPIKLRTIDQKLDPYKLSLQAV